MSNSSSYEQVFFNQLHIPEKLLTNYVHLGLNEKEVMVIIQLFRFIQKGNKFPTPSEIVESMLIDEKECANILRKLIQKNLLKIKQIQNEQHQLSEAYTLEPLFNTLYTETKTVSEDTEGDGTIFILFEQEFGRPLSPFEIEMVNTWLDVDKMLPSLIKAALRESVLMGKLNFKYIDRILREWKKKGIQSVQQARNASKNFHQKQVTKQDPNVKKRDTSIYYNWLEGED